MKRLLEVLFAVLIISLLPVSFAYAGTDQLTDTEKNSTYGFFVWLSENAETADERSDAEAAAQLLSNTVSSKYSAKVFNQGNISAGGNNTITYNDVLGTMNLGQKDDATSLDCLEESIDYATLGNTYRAKENLPALKISSALMAMSELNADYQAVSSGLAHTVLFGAMENLAYVGWYGSNYGASYDPYEGWYTEEKANYDSNNGKKTGHYLTLTDRQGKMLLTGFGVNYENGNTMQEKYFSQHFSTKSRMYDIGEGVTPEKYQSYLDQYKAFIAPAPQHTHAYDQKNTDAAYLKTEANCTSPAVYYYSCSCGEKGTATFESGKALGHSWKTEYTVDKEATETADGSKSIHCSVCDAVKEGSSEVIPKTGNGEGNPGDDQGDNDKTGSGTCGEHVTWTLSEEGVLTISGTGEMQDGRYGAAPWYDKRSYIKKVIIENGVTTIGMGAFESCSNMKSVEIPLSVTEIQESVFEGCTGLESITIHDKVTSIGDNNFSDTTTAEIRVKKGSLADIYLQSEGVKTIVYTCDFGHVYNTDAAVAPTCTADGKTEGSHCEVCGETIKAQETIPATGHNMTAHPEVPATYTSEGTEAYWTCSNCKKMFSDEKGANEIEEPTVIPKLAKDAQTVKVKTAAKTVKAGNLKKKASTVKPITVKGAQGTVSYKITGGNAKSKKALKINSKNGKVTVRKNTAKGKYTVKVKVSVTATDEFEPFSKTVSVTVKVK